MKKTGNHLTIRVPDPFDGSANARLKRMRVLDSDGSVSLRTMAAFSIIFTGLFFDDLCDSHGENDVLTIYETFSALSLKEDHPQMYLLMSVLYDYMRKPLPDPVWWLAGDTEAVSAFMAMFIIDFERIMKVEGILKPGGEVHSE